MARFDVNDNSGGVDSAKSAQAANDRRHETGIYFASFFPFESFCKPHSLGYLD